MILGEGCGAGAGAGAAHPRSNARGPKRARPDHAEPVTPASDPRPSEIGIRIDFALRHGPALARPVTPLWRGRGLVAVAVHAVPADHAGRPEVDAVVFLVTYDIRHPIAREVEIHLPLLPQFACEVRACVGRRGARADRPPRVDEVQDLRAGPATGRAVQARLGDDVLRFETGREPDVRAAGDGVAVAGRPPLEGRGRVREV